MKLVHILFILGWVLFSSSPVQASVIEKIRKTGWVSCGVSGAMAGFAIRQNKSLYSGFEVDLCRMISAAIFGDPDKVKFTELQNINDFLGNPEVDIVFHALTWTLGRELRLPIRFGPVVFF